MSYDDMNDVKNDSKNKQTLINNQSNELFDDEDYIPHTLINVKRIKLPGSGEDWEVMQDGVVVLTLKGTKLTKKEKSVLYTPVGLNIVISQYKSGNTSVSGLKKKLREHWEAFHDKV